MAAGTTTVTTINIPAYTALRGLGADQTILQNSASDAISMDSGSDPPGGSYSTNTTNVTSGNTSGSMWIMVSAPASYAVGDNIHFTELNATGVTPVGSGGSSGSWTDGWWSGNRARGQTVIVTSKGTSVCTGSSNANCLGISPPLYSDYPNSPLAVPYTALKYAGVENLQINGTNASGSSEMIWMRSCSYCWVKGIEVNMVNGSGNILEDRFGFRNEIRDNYFTGAYSHVTGGGENEIKLSFKTSGDLIENNIIERTQTAINVCRGSAGNVVAYNYITGSLSNNHNPPDEGSMGAVYQHEAHPQYNLMEGNVVPTLYPDSVWGTSYRLSFYRNWAQGINRACSPYTGAGTVNCSTSTWPTLGPVAVRVNALSTEDNFVGNVVGSALLDNNTSTLTKVATVVYPTGGCGWGTQACGWEWGQTTISGGNGTYSSANSCTTALYNGNYTSVGGASSLTWSSGLGCQNSSGSPITLPASFYKSSKPSWWGSLGWPSIGPDVTGGTGPGGHTMLTSANPAQKAYYAIGGTEGGAGGPFTFNADTLYGGVAPPTTYTVTPSAGAGGALTPSTPQTVNANSTTSFTVTANSGYQIASVTGCGGSLTGNTFTTGAITQDCTVTATFNLIATPGAAVRTGTWTGTLQ
jgi:hypothetical protein